MTSNVVKSFLVLSALLSFSELAFSAEHSESKSPHPKMTEVAPGEPLTAGTYIVIDPKGSITRSFCPYTCADRGLEKKHCKAWKSNREPDKCYLQDTRIPSDAVK